MNQKRNGAFQKRAVLVKYSGRKSLSPGQAVSRVVDCLSTEGERAISSRTGCRCVQATKPCARVLCKADMCRRAYGKGATGAPLS